MQIAIGSDHIGFDYKEQLKLFLIESGHVVDDFGPDSASPVDDARLVRAIAESIASKKFDRGIILGASGHRETIIANRVSRVRCTLCWDLRSAQWAREHDDANVLALGCRFLEFDDARSLVECWLETSFQRKRNARRVRGIDRMTGEPLPRTTQGPLPRRAVFIDEARYVCDCCGQEFRFPLDVSDGLHQQVVEECPVCCHENLLNVNIDSSGRVRIGGDPDITH